MLTDIPEEMLVKIFQKMEPISMTRSLRCSKKVLQIAPHIHMVTRLSMVVVAGNENSRIKVLRDRTGTILYNKEIPRNELVRTMKSFEPFKFSNITLYGPANVLREIFANSPIRCNVLNLNHHCGACQLLMSVLRPTTHTYINVNCRRMQWIKEFLETVPLGTLSSMSFMVRTTEALSIALEALPRRISIGLFITQRGFTEQAAILDIILSTARNIQRTGTAQTYKITVDTDVPLADIVNHVINSARPFPESYMFEHQTVFSNLLWALVAKPRVGSSPIILEGNIGQLLDSTVWSVNVYSTSTYDEAIYSVSSFFGIPENVDQFNNFRRDFLLQ